MFVAISIIAVLMLMITFVNKKYVSIILVAVSLVFLILVQYYHGSTFELLKGNYWIAFVSIIFLIGYTFYLFTFKVLSNFKNIYKKWVKNILYPIVEELLFSLVLILSINNKSTIDSFIAIIASSTAFVNMRIVLNKNHTYKDLLFLFGLSLITKIQAIYSNIFFALITHLLFSWITSIFKEKPKATYIKLLNGKIIENNVTFKSKTNYVIKGKNGTGKTTFAKLYSGLIGSCKSPNQNENQFGILMQEGDFEFNLKWYNDCYEFGKDYNYWVNQMKFEELVKTPYVKLSSGEKQRFKLIITMLMNKEKIFFDEIENSLDPKALEQILKVLKKHQKNHDVSYIFISHKDSKLLEEFEPIKISFSEKGVLYE